MIYVIDDDEVMAECIARNCGNDVRVYPDAISAMAAISEGEMPSLIFLDIMLDGPDGFTFLNELVSYNDTAKIPVVIVSSIDFGEKDLLPYRVVGVLDKCSMKPKDVARFVRGYE